MTCEWDDKIFNTSTADFNRLAVEIFLFQYRHNSVYRAYTDRLGVEAAKVADHKSIPFLPVSFFKTHKVKTGDFEPAMIFESSGTTQTKNSFHYVRNKDLYQTSFSKTFESFYGSIEDWCILGLLPSYLERENSSLIYMVEKLMEESKHTENGFFLHDHKKLADKLRSLEQQGQQTLLIGVTYALLDFAEKFSMPLPNTTIMETGGMKGRREELTRMEVHDRLMKAFKKGSIHSEYGMTELLSQAYSSQNGIFKCPPWMKVVIRDEEDPLEIKNSLDEKVNISGAINIIDLANVHSCSFIATDDAGKLYSDGSFEVLGRMDGSDLRGCSLFTV